MKKIIFAITTGILLFMSCQNDTMPTMPTLDITVDTTTCKVGVPVTFNLSGFAESISFYSGEVYHDYAFSQQGRILAVEDTSTLKLSVQIQGPGTRKNTQFFMYTSTDFNGNYASFNSVKTATWTDVSSQFGGTSSTGFTGSATTTNKVISTLVPLDKPVYVAYKCVYTPFVGLSDNWNIYQFFITANTVLGPQLLSDSKTTYSTGFEIIDQAKFDTVPPFGKVSKSYFSFELGSVKLIGPDTALVSKEIWAISKPVMRKPIVLEPDRPAVIKSITSEMKAVYTDQKYTKPGTYKVVFVASNNTLAGKQEIVKEVIVTIKP